jgi:ring-1,2-phenylacetyl-CoA epoxidase subunit PaaC
LGDTDVVLAQRLGEWIGHGPVLEEDIGLANIGLDLLGQGRLWLGLAGEVEAGFKGVGAQRDELAFLRDGGAFRNLQLVEMPNGDFAMTMARQFYFDHAHLFAIAALRDRPSAHRGKLRQGREGSHLSRRAQRRLGDPPRDAPTNRTRGRRKALDALWP